MPGACTGLAQTPNAPTKALVKGDLMRKLADYTLGVVIVISHLLYLAWSTRRIHAGAE